MGDSGDSGPTRSLLLLVDSASTPGPADLDPSEWQHESNEKEQMHSSFYQTIIDGARTKTFLEEQCVEELQTRDPATLAWLRSTSGLLFQVGLLAAYIIFETCSGLLVSRALEGGNAPLAATFVVVNSGASFLIGCVATVASASDPASGLKAVFNARSILSHSFVSALFNVSAVFSMMAMATLDVSMKKILDQLRLPLTAALSASIVGKRYNMQQFLLLCVLLLAVVAFYDADTEQKQVMNFHKDCSYPPHCEEFAKFAQPAFCANRVDGVRINASIVNGTCEVSEFLKGKQHESASTVELRGLVYSLLCTLFNCTGSLFSERFMKRDASTRFFTQKAQMECTGFFVALAMCFLVPLYVETGNPKAIWWRQVDAGDGSDFEGPLAGFFQGYNFDVLVAIAFETFLAWMGGIIVKKFSSLVKIIAKCLVLILTVTIKGTLLKKCYADVLPRAMYSLALVVIMSTILFSVCGSPSPAPPSHGVNSENIRQVRLSRAPMQQPLGEGSGQHLDEVQLQAVSTQ